MESNKQESIFNAIAKQKSEENVTQVIKPNNPTIEDCKKIADNFVQVFPNFCYIVTSNLISSSKFTGHKLLDYAGLRILKLAKNNNLQNVSNDELKQKCFIWVYDSKSYKNASERRDMLKQKIGDKFAGYNLWVAVAENLIPWSIRNAKA